MSKLFKRVLLVSLFVGLFTFSSACIDVDDHGHDSGCSCNGACYSECDGCNNCLVSICYQDCDDCCH
jgi:hypothetical protein